MGDIDALLAALDDEDDDGSKFNAIIDKMTKDLEAEEVKMRQNYEKELEGVP